MFLQYNLVNIQWSKDLQRPEFSFSLCVLIKSNNMGCDVFIIIEQRWRNPDLNEVIDFLSHPTNAIKANAAAYLQHLCYMDDPVKAKVR